MDWLRCATYDWVHNALQDGTLTEETIAFLKSAQTLGVTRAALFDFLKSDRWRFPRSNQKAKGVYRAFSPYRSCSSDPDKLKCSASELISLYGLLRHFFETQVPDADVLADARASFEAACHTIDLILMAKRRQADPAEVAPQLKAALANHMRLHLAAHGQDHIKPKHHWQMDIPDQLIKDGVVLDTFIIERTHLLVKGIADKVDNTSSFERSVLAGIINVMCNRAEPASLNFGVGSALFGRMAQLPGDHEVVVADRLSVFSLQVAPHIGTLLS